MPYNFSYIIPGKLAGCAEPGGYTKPLADDLAELKNEGIAAIVSLTEVGLDEALLTQQDFDYLHLPIVDFSPPAPDQINEFVEFVDTKLSGGEPVIVHCWAGQGRTGTMLAAYLVSRGYGAEDAIEHVRRERPGSIETERQVRAVENYERWLHERGLFVKRGVGEKVG